jgi:hypothetical protein
VRAAVLNSAGFNGMVIRRAAAVSAPLLLALREADQRRVETRVEYLKWHPVATLYARHGFRVIGENDSHYFLVRMPPEA